MSHHFAMLGDPEDCTVICTHDATASEVLEELRPLYVVLYDPDPAYIRAIELCQAMHAQRQMTVYFMMQQNSVEEQVRATTKGSAEGWLERKSVAALFEDVYYSLPLPLPLCAHF